MDECIQRGKEGRIYSLAGLLVEREPEIGRSGIANKRKSKVYEMSPEA